MIITRLSAVCALTKCQVSDDYILAARIGLTRGNRLTAMRRVYRITYFSFHFVRKPCVFKTRDRRKCD